MKKLLFLAASALLLASSCTNNEGASNNATKEEKEYGKEMSEALGAFSAGRAMEIKKAPGFDEKEFFRGIEAALKTDTANWSYVSGLMAGAELYNSVYAIESSYGIPMDAKSIVDSYKKTLKDSAANMQALQSNMMSVSQKVTDYKAKLNKKEGETFANKKVKEGFTKSASGLVYKIENAGSEDRATGNDKVSVKYTGKHINGNVFDSSNGEATTFSLNQVVRGFTEALQLIGKGGKITAVLPSDLAYGNNGNPAIAPGETLIFEIEIVDSLPGDPNDNSQPGAGVQTLSPEQMKALQEALDSQAK